MPLPVSYMGTKRQLAAFVSELVERSSPGPMLDVFAGMCAVGSAVAPKRQVWTNDL
ncbi:DNA adenine methylase, partial [Pigmentiphaga sp.]|uniref:DNA adenine methylase n=1 Tax=Pigmentiphaga sp. TaxID=1977564 RepID=UPI0039B93D52